MSTKRILLAVLTTMAISCKELPKETKVEPGGQGSETAETPFPEDLTKVFDAHGGIEVWKSKKTLIFEMPAEKEGEFGERHTVDLHSRRDRIDMGAISMGFDGSEVWLLDREKTYKGDPVFYHNLMFYFYAMPFVLGDDGIHYGETENLEYEGKYYPGIRIGYGDGIGASPKDEYFVHFDPDTHQMAWLGYTVTYRSGQKSDNIRWIRYNDWALLDGLVLPRSITWHEYEGRDIKAAGGTARFENVSLSEKAKPAAFYAKPEHAVTAVGKKG